MFPWYVGGVVMCCHVMWYEVVCLVPRSREDGQRGWLRDVILCNVKSCDVMWCHVMSCHVVSCDVM